MTHDLDTHAPDAHYTHPRLAALYDVDNGWGEDRDVYLALATEPARRVLEIGCGTGILARAYAARGHEVVGYDPAQAMLDVGAAEAHGDRVEWVCGYAEAMDLGARFDLIIMTGNAFQVLRDMAHVDATLAAVARHLVPGGRFVFESRNPHIDWEERWRASTSVYQTPEGHTVSQERRVAWYTGDRIRFVTTYHFEGGEQIDSRSELRFFDAQAITSAVERAGLYVEQLQGDWEGEAFDAARHDEMVFTVSHAT